MLTYSDLIKRIKNYSQNVNEDLIKKAYLFALKQHGTQVRESGELYFSHPLAVAQILIDLKMDQATVVSGLLHDTVEDTSATIPQLKELFGADVSRLVNGVTKLSRLEETKIAEQQAENYKKLLLAAASDIRVLIIKLADRLHNMRTLKFKKRKNRRAMIARETIEIYAPLAERIGMQRIKDELQDVAFNELYPELYKAIHDKLKNLYDSEDEIVTIVQKKLTEVLNQLDIPYTINGRIKTPYSIWNKMNVRTISFEQLSDIMAFRIVVQNAQQCYQVLGAIHRQYVVVPGRFRDYISTPKNNGYQSLHTCIIGPLNKRIEIQIRTKEMHLIAEYGIAAHWEYKESKNNSETYSTTKHHVPTNYQWLKSMVKVLNDTSQMDNFVKYSKTEIISENVFGITPKGEIIPLPLESSVLDFAYAIHTEIGNHAIGAEVNGIEVPLKTIINNGDKIKILTNKTATPHSIWQMYVKTIKATTAIRKALAGFEADQIEILGKSNFNELLKTNRVSISNLDFQHLIKNLGYATFSQFYKAIGSSSITTQEIVNAYEKLFNYRLTLPAHICSQSNNPERKIIIGLPNFSIKKTHCCAPILGDKIIGVVFHPADTQPFIEIHTEECECLKKACLNSNTQIIELCWNSECNFENIKFIGRLFLSVLNQPGNLSNIANTIEHLRSEIVSLNIGEKNNNFIEIYIEFKVRTFYHLREIITSLRLLPFIQSVIRK